MLLALLLFSPPSYRHSVPIKQVRCRASSAAPRTAPLSPPAISSSTHTHNAQVPVPSMPHPIARVTIPRFVRALFAVSASPSTPAARTPLRSLTADHAAAHSPSAIEGLLTRATHRHQLLLCSGRTARTPLRIAARALLALRSIRLLPPPFSSSTVFRPRAPSQK